MKSPWGPFLDQRLLVLIRSGKTAVEAGAALGVTHNSCLARARLIGVPFPRKNHRNGRKGAPNWSEQEVNELRTLAKRLTAEQIAAELGRPLNGIYHAMRQHGVVAQRKPVIVYEQLRPDPEDVIASNDAAHVEAVLALGGYRSRAPAPTSFYRAHADGIMRRVTA